MQNNHLETTTTIRKALLTINITLAILWIYQGIIPKLLYRALDEQRLWQLNGVDEITMLILIQFAGYIEIIFGVFFLIFRQSKLLHYLNIFGMFGLAMRVFFTDSSYFSQAFNPFVMNVAMAVLSIVALQFLSEKSP